MKEFQQKYIEDAGELITQLESQLINFENDITNKEIIQEIFRVMHTLKGTSGMFGFHRIEEFTHLLEDIYDLVRNEHLVINQDIINLTFDSVDLIKLMLQTKENFDYEQEIVFKNTISVAQKYSTAKPQTGLQLQKEKQTESQVLLYRIVFRPDSKILLRGILPISIMEELTHLGVNAKFQFTDESIEIIDKNTFNTYWEVFLIGTVQLTEIEDVFMFFDESEYSVEKLTDASDSALEFFLLNSLSIKNNISLQELITQTKEVIAFPIEQKPTVKPLPEVNISKPALPTPSEDSIRVPSRKLDNLLNLVSELIITHSQFENHAARINDELLKKTVKELSKLSRNFRDEILSTRLIPISVLSTGIQRIVRDISQKLNKKVELVFDGSQTELDKHIIDRIENPLMHIIRNCLDHGLESPSERITNNKKETGIIRIIAFYSGASVFIQIQDDGRGIDTNKIREKAIYKGFIRSDNQLTTKQIYELIFLPGFSTANEITEISGRGVGLDAVKNVITDLHGEINIDSEIGLGTSFTIKLPLTLSIVDSLLVNCHQYKILIPTGNIMFCKYIPSNYFEGKELQYEVDKKCVPVKRLSAMFDSASKVNEFEILIIVSIYDKLYGLLVDRIIASLQAVIKPLGVLHREQPYFVGASQLGDGTTAYILDTNFLLKI